MVKKCTKKTDPKWTKVNKIDYKKDKKIDPQNDPKMIPKWIITNRMAKKGLKMVNGLQTDPKKNRN